MSIRILLFTLLLSLAMPITAKESIREKGLVEKIERIRNKNNVPAVGLLLVTPNFTLVSRSWGVADVATQRPATEKTVFRIGSITKAFTSLMFLSLDAKKSLQLNDLVSKFGVETPYKNPWYDTNPITIAHLLEHTAGLTDMSGAEFNYVGKPLTLTQAFAIDPESRKIRWPPGLHSSYSNSGAGIAAWAAETHLEQPFENLVRTEIFEPLGMTSAVFYETDTVKKHLASGYQADGKTTIPYWNMIYRAFGAINVTVDDMTPFLQLLLNSGQHKNKTLLPVDAIRRMEQPKTSLAARNGLNYGYGLGNYQWYRDGYLFHGHGGDGDGYLAHYGYNRDKNLAYFVVINAFNHRPLREMRAAIESHILDGARRTPPERLSILKTEHMHAIAGEYTMASQRFFRNDGTSDTLNVSVDDGILYTQINAGKRLELVPVNEQHFRRPYQPQATIAIIQTDKHMIIQGDFGNYQKPIDD